MQRCKRAVSGDWRGSVPFPSYTLEKPGLSPIGFGRHLLRASCKGVIEALPPVNLNSGFENFLSK
jgi:hypothetical protein